MSDEARRHFLASLLSQDQAMSSATYEEYRTMLQSKLDSAVIKARFARRMTIWVWVAAVTCLVVGGIGETLDNRHLVPQPLLPVVFVIWVSGQVLFYYGVFRVAWYLAVERRGPQIVRQEMHDTMLLELSRKVDALAQRVETLSPR